MWAWCPSTIPPSATSPSRWASCSPSCSISCCSWRRARLSGPLLRRSPEQLHRGTDLRRDGHRTAGLSIDVHVDESACCSRGFVRTEQRQSIDHTGCAEFLQRDTGRDHIGDCLLYTSPSPRDG